MPEEIQYSEKKPFGRATDFVHALCLLAFILAVPVSLFFIVTGVSHVASVWQTSKLFAQWEQEEMISFNELCNTFSNIQRDPKVPIFEEWNAYCLKRNKEFHEKADSYWWN